MGGQRGEQVVLDLMAQVAAHDVKQLPTGEVCRTQQLAVVPVPVALLLQHVLGELVRARR